MRGRDKPLSAYWRLAGFVVGFAGAVVFAALRATAVITQRTFVNYPTLWCCVILDVAVFVIVLFARRITADWHNHRALLDIANLVAALAIAATTFRALPDVILRLTIFVEPGDPIFTSDMLLRALGFALGAAVAIIAALIFRTMRSTAVRWSFTTAVLLLVALLFAQHFTDLAQILNQTHRQLPDRRLPRARVGHQPSAQPDHRNGARLRHSGNRQHRHGLQKSSRPAPTRRSHARISRSAAARKRPARSAWSP